MLVHMQLKKIQKSYMHHFTQVVNNGVRLTHDCLPYLSDTVSPAPTMRRNVGSRHLVKPFCLKKMHMLRAIMRKFDTIVDITCEVVQKRFLNFLAAGEPTSAVCSFLYKFIGRLEVFYNYIYFTVLK